MYGITKKFTLPAIISAVFLLLAGFSSFVSAQEAADSESSFYYVSDKGQAQDWLRTTTINFGSIQDNKPEFSIETVQPFRPLSDKGQFWFWQGRYGYQGDTKSTVNLGFGWRKLADDKGSILGLNTFYDYGFNHNFSRIGVGLEYFNKLLEARFNTYCPLSGERYDAATDSNIRAVHGVDWEIGSSFKNARWLSLSCMGFYYDNNYTDKYKGYRIRSNMQLTPHYNLELGYWNFANNKSDFYAKVTYNLANCFGSSLRGGKKEAASHNDLTDKLLQKVERQNNILTETKTQSVSGTGTAVISVRYLGQVNVGDGYPVSTTVNGVTRTVTTTDGLATFPDLPPGDYDFSAPRADAGCRVHVTAGAVANGQLDINPMD